MTENDNQKLDLIMKMIEQQDKRFEQMEAEMARRFEQIDKRFDQIDKRFEQIDKRLERIEDNQVLEKKRLDDVYEAREKVKVTFGWQWGMMSMFIAIIASGITKIFS